VCADSDTSGGRAAPYTLYLSKSTACRDQVRTSLAIELHESRVCVWVSVQYEHVLHVN